MKKYTGIYIGTCKCGKIVSAHVDLKDKSTREWVGEMFEGGLKVERVEAENVTLSQCICTGSEERKKSREADSVADHIRRGSWGGKAR